MGQCSFVSSAYVVFVENSVAFFQRFGDVCLEFFGWVSEHGFEIFLREEGSNFLVVFVSCTMTTVLPLSASVIMALFLLSLLCMFFASCSCRLCVLSVLW